MAQFLVRVLQLSHGDAAARIHAAVALGPRTSMLGEQLEPLLPGLAVLQRDGVVSAVKVQMVERAMHKLTRPNLHPAAVQTAERLLTGTGTPLGARRVAKVRPGGGECCRPRRPGTHR